jgi:hypothetical protein
MLMPAGTILWFTENRCIQLHSTRNTPSTIVYSTEYSTVQYSIQAINSAANFEAMKSNEKISKRTEKMTVINCATPISLLTVNAKMRFQQ